MCWCFIDYWIEKCTVKHWNYAVVFFVAEITGLYCNSASEAVP